ncbi:MAG TPA: lipopolysaccharide biosynthesis protein, partial [Pirellulales bacterium]|nr:lipopolysaccharide biosynthesis protein [Pirellulales bacterium]
MKEDAGDGAESQSAVSERLEDKQLANQQELQDGLANATSDASATFTPVRRGHVRRVVEGTFNYGLGQSIPQIIKLCLIWVFTRLLSPTEFGSVQLATQFSNFVTTLMRQGVPGAVARYYYDHAEGPSLRDYVATVAWYLLASSLVVGLITLAICPWVLPHLVPGLPMSLAFLSVLGGIATVNGELQGRLVQAREQSAYQARLNVGRASVSLALVVIFVIWPFRSGAPGMIASEVVSFGVLALVAIWYLRAELRGRFQKSMLKSSLVYGWAMMPGDFVGNLTPLATAALLSGAHTAAANGLYFLALRVTQPLTMIGLAFQQAYNPIYFSIRKEGEDAGLKRLADTARNVWAAAVGCAVAAALLGPPLIVLVTPADYHAAAPLVPIFALSFLGLTAYNFVAPEVFYSKRTWLVPVIVYGAAAIEITIAAVTVRSWGAAGVATGAA